VQLGVREHQHDRDRIVPEARVTVGQARATDARREARAIGPEVVAVASNHRVQREHRSFGPVGVAHDVELRHGCDDRRDVRGDVLEVAIRDVVFVGVVDRNFAEIAYAEVRVADHAAHGADDAL
jgi:hypothetical protein